MKTASARPNLRHNQRADVDMEVQVCTTSGDQCSCATANLSRSGLLLKCDMATVSQLLPHQRPPVPGEWIEVTTRFSVPVVASQKVAVEAQGHIVHLRRVSRDEFHLGIQFKAIENNGYDYVDRYVSRLLGSH
ncbi:MULTISPECIES: PilZ domain-containing protein [Marinobacter]|uniref:PilZ domain-containing protein n=1 Tax=Marinobacter xestospongiae TaxID=994319 RepID=A0ABU3VS65_9GAMM|nr:MULTISPECIES: PilZ domain-containing protein [Marinobacter]MCG8516529.1 PilZ domain-containing protein [Pseudomonadales bacterium]MCK7566980.1 PilZ domain-containing protein [Marinobacter xestospongiae]MDV2077098.1 PilZ domain-containing protein [Marinobacter xestospongiae]UDL03910.1 PilZ domain-containing protein [Marinobacter sp. CA1]